MEENKIYTWYPENSDKFYDEFNSMEEAIASAKSDFINKNGEFYGEDNNCYSTRICIGTVEYLDMDSLVDNTFNDLLDNLLGYVEDFAFGMNYEAECYAENKENAKKKLRDILENDIYINPNKKSRTFKGYYDLLLDKWV